MPTQMNHNKLNMTRNWIGQLIKYAAQEINEQRAAIKITHVDRLYHHLERSFWRKSNELASVDSHWTVAARRWEWTVKGRGQWRVFLPRAQEQSLTLQMRLKTEVIYKCIIVMRIKPESMFIPIGNDESELRSIVLLQLFIFCSGLRMARECLRYWYVFSGHTWIKKYAWSSCKRIPWLKIMKDDNSLKIHWRLDQRKS